MINTYMYKYFNFFLVKFYDKFRNDLGIKNESTKYL